MEDHIVTISTGKIRGKTGKNYNNEVFYSFQGIPYAKPPIGALRFKAPQPAERWAGIRDATTEGPQCFSRIPLIGHFLGGEDCLFLNVYTPNIKKNKKLKPVMVFIHGGSFTSGSGNSDFYGPEFLMTQDIVLVTINYRTGILGFLSLHDPDLGIPGNAGFKYMVMALKWVQQNIRAFSGDPKNVTIFGQSAGAASCHYLMLSPMAKGLFHKAILQSGCALNVWAKGLRCAVDVAKNLGLQSTDERKILETLLQVPVQELFEAAEKLPDHFIASTTRPHGPVVETNSQGAFLNEDPNELLKSGRYNRVPIIIGYTNREGMLTEILQRPKPFSPLSDYQLAVPNFLKLQPDSDISKMIGFQIKRLYFGNEEPSTRNKDKFYMLETDNFFLREILYSVKHHVATSPYPVFLYRMSIETGLNMLKTIFSVEEPGVCHADDLGYLFNSLVTPRIEPNSDEEVGMRRFVNLWTNFAKYGDPTPRVKSRYIDVKWRPVTRNAMTFLDIGKRLTTDVNPEQQRMAFWDDIIKIINPVNKL